MAELKGTTSPITDLPNFLKANADAIRYAKGTTEKINAQDFADEIKKMKKISVEPLSITQNGTYTAPEGSAYSPVEVNVSSGNTLKKLLDTTKSCYYLFRNYDGTSVDDLISYDDTSNVTDMSSMFYKCSNLTTVPEFDTSNVANMYNMFNNCKSLTSVPTFDTSNVTNMRSMFQSCSNLTTVPEFDTSNVDNMSGMFSTCTSLKSILMYGMKVSFDISASTKFERSDLVTILNNLATVTTTQTLTMRSANLAKLTNEDKEIAIANGWTLA